MSLDVEVDIRQLEIELESVDRFLDDQFVPFIVQFADMIANEMKNLAPVRFGRLRASITVSQQGRDVYIGPTVDYAQYVVKGTRPSPGRYVPAIEKRLVNPEHPSFGTHPGIAPNPFIEETTRFVEWRFLETIRQQLARKVDELT